jgi:hypothetical protein
MSWTNNHPSPAEHIIWPVGEEQVSDLFDPAHVRRIVKRAAPFLSRLAKAYPQFEAQAPEIADLLFSIMSSVGQINLKFFSNGTFTLAVLASPQLGLQFGVASRMETDREDLRVAKRIAGARALHAFMFNIERGRLDEATRERIELELAAGGIQLEE